MSLRIRDFAVKKAQRSYFASACTAANGSWCIIRQIALQNHHIIEHSSPKKGYFCQQFDLWTHQNASRQRCTLK